MKALGTGSDGDHSLQRLIDSIPGSIQARGLAQYRLNSRTVRWSLVVLTDAEIRILHGQDAPWLQKILGRGTPQHDQVVIPLQAITAVSVSPVPGFLDRLRRGPTRFVRIEAFGAEPVELEVDLNAKELLELLTNLEAKGLSQ